LEFADTITEQQIQITKANDHRDNFADDVREGLTRKQKVLSPKYFYDERGSKLFDKICDLPEYYQTRTELKILKRISGKLAKKYQPTTLIEYGAGAATKTRFLLDAMEREGNLNCYVPIDVSGSFLRSVAGELADTYPNAKIHGLVGDFLLPITLPFPQENRLIAFLGSTIGNLTDNEADKFLHLITGQMNENDYFLLGTDLVKETAVLEKAYNDDTGITADFNKNILRIINNRLSGEFSLEKFDHHAFYNELEGQIEMHLVAREDHQVFVNDLDLQVDFRKGETIRTEISCKYTRDRVQRILMNAGLELVDWITDSQDYFGLSVSRLAE